MFSPSLSFYSLLTSTAWSSGNFPLPGASLPIFSFSFPALSANDKNRDGKRHNCMKEGIFPSLIAEGDRFVHCLAAKASQVEQVRFEGRLCDASSRACPLTSCSCLLCLQLYWRHRAWNGTSSDALRFSKQLLCRRSSHICTLRGVFTCNGCTWRGMYPWVWITNTKCRYRLCGSADTTLSYSRVRTHLKKPELLTT